MSAHTRVGVSPAALRGMAVLAALVAAAAVLASTRLGAGATPDSGHYLATADSLLKGRGFVRLGPEIMTSWPPLYPAILAAFGMIGVDMLQGARAVNVVALAITAAVCALWVGSRTSSLALAGAAGLGAALGPPLVYSGSLALTDAPFVPLLALALWRLDVWLERPGRSTLIACVASIALACLMRYNGVVIVATAVLAALTLARMPFGARFKHAVLIGAAASAPLALWFARNVWLTGNVAGPRVPSTYPLSEACADAGYTVMAWFLPYRIMVTSPWTGLALLAVLVAGLAVIGWRWRDSAPGRTILLCVTFVGIFLAFMIFTFTRVSVDPLADRMMAPVYVPLLVALLASTAAILKALAPSHRRIAAVPIGGAILIVLAVLGSRTAGVVTESWREGPGGSAHSNFNTPQWRASPTLVWAGQELRDELLFASTPAALYIATGVTSRPMPRKHARRSPGVPHDSLPELREEVQKAGEAFLVISNGHVPSHTFSIEELSAAFVVEPVRTFPDGIVYRLTANPGPPEP